nr:epoxide hydrolase N-terminal domain-containing protein [Mesorhizobium sp.]
MHFVHVRSKHPNALPLIMTHDWPGFVLGSSRRSACSRIQRRSAEARRTASNWFCPPRFRRFD